MNLQQLKINALILCPLALEKKYFLEALNSVQSHNDAHVIEPQLITVGHLQGYYFESLKMLVAQGGHGKVQFALQTQFFTMQLPQIQNVICAGCAGSLIASVKNLDVVIATETIEHDYQIKFVKRNLPVFKADENLLRTAQQASEDGFLNSAGYHIHFGSVASGDEDIIDADRSKELHKKTQALAVAWEGAGGVKACQFLKKSYLEVRGISDSADHQALADFEKNLQVVMTHVAQVVLQIVTQKV